MLKLPRCPTLTLVQTFSGGCNLSLWFCCLLFPPCTAVCGDSEMTAGHGSNDSCLSLSPRRRPVSGNETQWYMASTAARMIGQYFTVFYCGDIHRRGRDPGPRSEWYCLSLTLVQPPPAKSCTPASPDQSPARSVHHSTRHAGPWCFTAISFGTGRCTASDWLSVREGLGRPRGSRPSALSVPHNHSVDTEAAGWCVEASSWKTDDLLIH